jgi:HD-GYP domain-containing protein (c-di-GMP phosphodiesterase class II)
MHVRFALVSFAAVLLVAASFAYLAMLLISSSQEEAAAHAASGLTAPLRQVFADAPAGEGVSADRKSLADLLSKPLISSSVVGLQVWDDNRSAIYGYGATAASQHVPNSGSLVWERAATADGTGLFVTYVRSGDYTFEVDQNRSALSSSNFRAQRTLLMLDTGFAILAFLLLQAAFWFGIRRFREAHQRLLYMYNTGDEIRSSLDLHEVVTHLSRDATRLAHGDYGLVALFDDATGDLVLHATYDNATGIIAHHQRAVEEWFLRRCVATNTTVTSVQPASGYRQYFGHDAPLEGQLHLVCVPVSLRDRVVGVVGVVRSVAGRRGGFAASEIAQVEELAGQGVTAVEQAQLFAKVRGHADEIELSYDATLKALMAALDAKDEVTEGHCERVAKLTIQLAKEMGIPEAQLVDIERGALLHDVGKIGVPDAVLKKPDALNDGEWEAMRKHPLLASLMVSKIGFLENAMPILLYHHERFDGGGYPFGLTGDKIPLEARIFSIIDAYDAMTSDRPYRDAMTHDVAMAEVRSNSGVQFDPEVVEAFEGLMAGRPELRHQIAHRMVDHDHDDHAGGPAEHAA